MREALDLDPHVRQRAVNFGDTTKLAGAEQKQLFSLTVREPTTWTVYASARVEGPPAEALGVVPIVKLEWGHGGAGLSRERPLLRHMSVRLAASTVGLSARLVRPDGTAPSAQVRATIVAFAARGFGDEPGVTRWVHLQGAEGLLATGATSLVRLSGFNAGSERRRWVMLFDAIARPAEGSAARFAAPAMRFASTPFSLPAADWVRGLYFCASSSPAALVFDARAVLRVDAEVL